MRSWQTIFQRPLKDLGDFTYFVRAFCTRVDLCPTIVSGTRMEKFQDWLADRKQKSEQYLSETLHFSITASMRISYNGLMLLKKVVSTYLDLTTDFILLSSVLYVLGTDIYDIENFTKFPVQITLLLTVSIVLPIFSSAVMIAYNQPLSILFADQASYFQNNQDKTAILAARVVIILLFPVVPALIILSAEKAKFDRQSLKGIGHTKEDLGKDSVVEHSIRLSNHLDETRLGLLVFKRNELSMELIIQQSITLTMLLLSKTLYPIESGLQSIFEDESSSSSETSFFFDLIGVQEKVQSFEKNHNVTFWFLVASNIWSFKTLAKTAVKIKTEKKNYLPFLPKIVLTFRYLVVFVIRIGAIVTYVSPFIGLNGLMNHFQAETKALNPRIWKHLTNPDEKDLFRSNYKDLSNITPPPSTVYTLVNFGQAYLIFGILFFTYGLILTLFKSKINCHFKAASIGAKFQHVIEVLNAPDAYGDWDEYLDLDLNQHKTKWMKILIEMLVMCLMQVVWNLLMLVPFLITGKNKFLFLKFSYTQFKTFSIKLIRYFWRMNCKNNFFFQFKKSYK